LSHLLPSTAPKMDPARHVTHAGADGIDLEGAVCQAYRFLGEAGIRMRPGMVDAAEEVGVIGVALRAIGREPDRVEVQLLRLPLISGLPANPAEEDYQIRILRIVLEGLAAGCLRFREAPAIRQSTRQQETRFDVIRIGLQQF